MEKKLILTALVFLQHNFDGEIAGILFDAEFDDEQLDELSNLFGRLYRQIDEGQITIYNNGQFADMEEEMLLNGVLS